MRLHVLTPLLLGLLFPTAASLKSIQLDRTGNASAKPKISDSSFEQIRAVWTTLSDIAASIEAEEKTEAASYKKYAEWCKSEKKRLGTLLGGATSEQEQSDLEAKELNATISHSQKALDDLAQSIQDMSDVIKKAEALRAKEKAQYASDMQLNRESLDQVIKAIKIVGKVHGQGGFLQQGHLQRLRLNEPGESSYVLGIMKGLKMKLEKARKSLEAEEKEKVDMHAKFLQAKQAAVKSFKDESVQKKGVLTQSSIDLIETRTKNKRSTKQLAQAKTLLEDVKSQCAAKAEAWHVRKIDRGQEIAALHDAMKAIEVIAKKEKKAASLAQERAEEESGFIDADELPLPPALLQLQAGIKRALRSDADEASDVGAVLAKGNFAGAKSAVKKLIGVLVKEQAEEDDKLKYCKAELDKKNKEEAALKGEAAELAAGVEYKTKTVESLGADVKKSESDRKKLEKAAKDAFKLRQDERKTFEAGSKDRKLAIKVLKQAVKVLNKFYARKDKIALLQQSVEAEPPTLSHGSRKDVQASGAIGMLEKVITEIQYDEDQATKAEEGAVKKFEKFQVDNLKEIDKLSAAITAQKVSKAKLGVQLNTNKETDVAKKGDLDTAKSQIKALHKECDELMKKYKERTKARTWEINQLRDVRGILNGANIAVRTGLLQGPATVVGGDPEEAALLRQLDGTATPGN